jgi:hypothetical protein
MTFARRDMLRLLALAGASSLAPILARPRSARAADATVPKRLVFFFSQHGTIHQYAADGTLAPFWSPTAAFAPDPLKIQTPWVSTDFKLGELHQALVPYQKQLVLLDGLDMVSALHDPIAAGDAHTAGMTHALTGANRLSPVLAGGISIDQLIAKGINTPSPVTALPSLEILVNVTQGNGKGNIYAGSGQPIPVLASMKDIYQRMLPNGPQNGGDAAAQAKLALQLAQQQSVLTHAANGFSNLAGKLGKLDAARLNAHAAAVRDLESRLSIGAQASCTEPDAKILDGASSVNWDETDEALKAAAYAANANIAMQLAQVALACDLTRVLSFSIDAAPDNLIGYNHSDVPSASDIHDLIHKTNGSSPVLGNDPKAMTVLKNYHTYNAGLFAKFLGLLQAIPEADGTSLLDNTLVVWCGADIGGGDHSLDHLPLVLAGGLAGSVKTGRYVLFPRTKSDKAWPVYSQGLPHNNFFVSLANLMGLPTTSFGNPAVCTGALTGWNA